MQLTVHTIAKGFTICVVGLALLEVGYVWGAKEADNEDRIQAEVRKRLRVAGDKLQSELRVQRRMDKEFHEIVGE